MHSYMADYPRSRGVMSAKNASKSLLIPLPSLWRKDDLSSLKAVHLLLMAPIPLVEIGAMETPPRISPFHRRNMDDKLFSE
ncbi:hypothetical protein TNIN_161241 [Trichonephila inaurata madagascariensis]|uniref:Uncharacterized protein n=1 Tax=Trichonephila inaurata madagascariensis TaxID=2747483 RepID=A0A8X7BW96_9ARAC|nr:hypothetical protein TNIN_161241 [Trichonephila inaurata madagascariensis]